MSIKICNTCNLEKELVKFEKGKNIYKGKITEYYSNKCKDCNRERVNTKNRKSKSRNRQKLNDAQKVYYSENKEIISIYAKQYYQLNKDQIKARVKEYTYKRRETDPIFRLKESISSNIRGALIKNSRATFSMLPYTVQELKEHLEKQFESWMTWENYGVYRVGIWDDNDVSTWTWQIDHIIPHSKFNYTSTEDKAFRECWTLDNLRPYSAKQNVIDGVR